MSLRYLVSMVFAAAIGYMISPSYSGETVFCNGFESCPQVGDLETRIALLEALLDGASRGDDPNTGQDTLTFSGMNIRVVNGTGTTDGTPTGTGNLIIGYNETGNPSGDNRTGSHMLVIGRKNTYTSYGGMVVGSSNSVTDAHASISGGLENTASFEYASVSGGSLNTASGVASWVGGGYNNVASGGSATVSGGESGVASGSGSSVSGGLFNQAIGIDASVSGGKSNLANGDHSSVSGGTLRTAEGMFCWEGGSIVNC